MKILDITLPMSNNLPVWPDDPPIKIERISKLEMGDNCNVSAVSMSVHTGTHVDAPFHFLSDGGAMESLSLDILIGEVQVIQLADTCDWINREVLEQADIKPGVIRLLIRTRNSNYWAKNEMEFQTDFVGIDESGAKYLVEKGIRLIGMDYLSVSPFKISRPTHLALLSAGVIPLEGLNLMDVPAGFYQLYCLPLKLMGTDGAPVRAVLISED